MAAASSIAPQIGEVMQGFRQQPAQNAQPAQQQDDMAAFKVKVEKLSMMKENGLISEEEFAQMKAKLLAEIM